MVFRGLTTRLCGCSQHPVKTGYSVAATTPVSSKAMPPSDTPHSTTITARSMETQPLPNLHPTEAQCPTTPHLMAVRTTPERCPKMPLFRLRRLPPYPAITPLEPSTEA